MKNTGLYQECQIWLKENDKTDERSNEDWTQDHPLLHLQMAHFLDNFLSVSFAAVAQEHERIDDVLIMLDIALQNKDEPQGTCIQTSQHVDCRAIRQ